MSELASSTTRSDSRTQRSDGAGLPRDLTVVAPGEAAWFTVVVPTRNEADNVGPLLTRLRDAMRDAVCEVLFVDDSTDDTPLAIERAARSCGLPVRLLHRPPEDRLGGLGGAVVAGLRHARGTWAVVMDADLQHPPELAPRLAAVGQARQLDLVAGSRYIGSGEADGLGGTYRHLVSTGSTVCAKSIFPRRLSRLSDPMSGFFAVRLAALDLSRLRPDGFKILLEIAVRHPRLRVAEVPFVFGDRASGESKASVAEGMRYVRQVARLRAAVFSAQLRRSSTTSLSLRLRRLILFGAVGVSGIGVNTAALWLFSSSVLVLHYLLAAVIATEASTTWNFLLTETVVFRGPKPGSRWGRGVKFYLVNHAALLLRLPLLALLVQGIGMHVLTGNLVTLVMLFLVRFAIADSAIYAREPEATEAEPMRIIVSLAAPASAAADQLHARPGSVRPGSNYLQYRYRVDGIGTIGSQVMLRELEYFRAQSLGGSFDLEIRVGHVGRGTPRSRARLTQFSSPPGLSYEEHFGRLGANFQVEIGQRISVTVSPMLAHSPHVVYTNIIEALLRFMAASSGRILLHSACLDLNGRGLLMSARTDTGKTGTVLRLVRERGAGFLSDDMTILSANGIATCFPKPLTISQHTLRAVQAGDLTHAEWRHLRVQSRLHSRDGRAVGMMLARLNVPIMGFNAITQRIVPPPKYNVDRLVPCNVVQSVPVSELFVIERGPELLADIPFAVALETLIINTDDAYGFPPFRQMAPSIVIGADDYQDLRAKEKAILAEALGHIRARRLATDDFSWADRIPALVAERDRTCQTAGAVATAAEWAK
jgi:glycosyltransferase involved in cell wall biosynthesis